MKHENLANALNEIKDEYIAEAIPKKQRRSWRWVGTLAAILAVVITTGGILWLNASRTPEAAPSLNATDGPIQPSQNEDPALLATGLVAKPAYPVMVQAPDINSENYWANYDAWQASLNRQYDQPSDYAMHLDGFFMDSASAFLSGGTENAVYSPANVYMSLAMLAETTGGETRQQILELLNAESIEQLRTQAGHLWNAHYCDDGATKLLLANSLWLDSTLPYKAGTASTLAKDYYASVYHGDLGTPEMNGALRAWLDANTGGLLKDQIADLELDARTMLALASTIHYKVKWGIYFNEAQTKEGIFYGPEGEQTVEYMYSSFYAIVLESDNACYVSVPLADGCKMKLILPKEGYTPQDVLTDDDMAQFLRHLDISKVHPNVDVNLQLPKFDVVSETDLCEGLQEMGITKVFSPSEADFSAITDEQLFLSEADHAARVKIDEEGIEAAAYTVMAAPGAGAPIEKEEVDFIVDRPFVFVIEGRNRVPLFIGVVNEP